MTTTGSSDLNTFFARAHRHLTQIRGSLDRTLADIEEGTSRVGESLQARRDEAKGRVEANRREMEKADAEMKAYADAKKATVETAVSEWKAKRNVERLESRADDVEAYAATAVAFAWGAVGEANAAILDAMVARADADEAKEAATAGR
jgi:hypothetical protein